MRRGYAVAARTFCGRRSVTIALALAMVLAGCPGATSDVGTVTPAPVPSPPPVTDESSVRSCGVPTPQPLDSAASPESAPVPATVPVENGTVNGSALVDRHERRLLGRSYRLSTPGYTVTAAPNGSAFRVAAGTSVTPVRHYVAGNHRYTFTRRLGGRNIYETHRHDGVTFRDAFGDVVSLTGGAWLEQALATAPHRVETRRPDGWTVLRADPENHTETGNRTVSVLNSTVHVDRRGIVRSVEQRLIVADDGINRMIVRRFAVTGLGNTSVETPSWLCEAVRDGHVPPV